MVARYALRKAEMVDVVKVQAKDAVAVKDVAVDLAANAEAAVAVVTVETVAVATEEVQAVADVEKVEVVKVVVSEIFLDVAVMKKVEAEKVEVDVEKAEIVKVEAANVAKNGKSLNQIFYKPFCLFRAAFFCPLESISK